MCRRRRHRRRRRRRRRCCCCCCCGSERPIFMQNARCSDRQSSSAMARSCSLPLNVDGERTRASSRAFAFLALPQRAQAFAHFNQRCQSPPFCALLCVFRFAAVAWVPAVDALCENFPPRPCVCAPHAPTRAHTRALARIRDGRAIL